MEEEEREGGGWINMLIDCTGSTTWRRETIYDIAS